MKKLFSFIIKILPLITIYKGITSGGARLKPFIDTGKVTMTQYEVGEISKIILKDYEKTQTWPQNQQDFSLFIKNKFENQYSVLAREIRGDRQHDHTKDLWDHPFEIEQKGTWIFIISRGPDGKKESKDDIFSQFEVVPPEGSHLALKEPPRKVIREEIIEEVIEEEGPSRSTAQVNDQYDEEGFDIDGFNQAGFDRDGYDRNGIHQSEKSLSYH